MGTVEPEGLCDVLFADALVAARLPAVSEGVRIVDIGSGGGAPALPLALLLPNAHFTLVEPRRKRVAFLRTAIGTVALGGRATVIEGRLGAPRVDGTLEAFAADLAMSRATFAPEQWLALGIRLAPRVMVFSADRNEPPAVEGSSVIDSVAYGLRSTPASRSIFVYQRDDAGA